MRVSALRLDVRAEHVVAGNGVGVVGPKHFLPPGRRPPQQRLRLGEPGLLHEQRAEVVGRGQRPRVVLAAHAVQALDRMPPDGLGLIELVLLAQHLQQPRLRVERLAVRDPERRLEARHCGTRERLCLVRLLTPQVEAGKVVRGARRIGAERALLRNEAVECALCEDGALHTCAMRGGAKGGVRVWAGFWEAVGRTLRADGKLHACALRGGREVWAGVWETDERALRKDGALRARSRCCGGGGGEGRRECVRMSARRVWGAGMRKGKMRYDSPCMSFWPGEVREWSLGPPA
eukprot:361170-Chlamydomonas_euryale.AAC.1